MKKYLLLLFIVSGLQANSNDMIFSLVSLDKFLSNLKNDLLRSLYIQKGVELAFLDENNPLYTVLKKDQINILDELIKSGSIQQQDRELVRSAWDATVKREILYTKALTFRQQHKDIVLSSYDNDQAVKIFLWYEQRELLDQQIVVIQKTIDLVKLVKEELKAEEDAEIRVKLKPIINKIDNDKIKEFEKSRLTYELYTKIKKDLKTNELDLIDRIFKQNSTRLQILQQSWDQYFKAATEKQKMLKNLAVKFDKAIDFIEKKAEEIRDLKDLQDKLSLSVSSLETSKKLAKYQKEHSDLFTAWKQYEFDQSNVDKRTILNQQLTNVIENLRPQADLLEEARNARKILYQSPNDLKIINLIAKNTAIFQEFSKSLEDYLQQQKNVKKSEELLQIFSTTLDTAMNNLANQFKNDSELFKQYVEFMSLSDKTFKKDDKERYEKEIKQQYEIYKNLVNKLEQSTGVKDKKSMQLLTLWNPPAGKAIKYDNFLSLLQTTLAESEKQRRVVIMNFEEAFSPSLEQFNAFKKEKSSATVNIQQAIAKYQQPQDENEDDSDEE